MAKAKKKAKAKKPSLKKIDKKDVEKVLTKKRAKRGGAVLLRHKALLKELAENGGSLRKALKKLGYSKVVQNNPKKVTDSKSWQELMDEFLSDEELAKHHEMLLNHKKIDYQVFPAGTSDEDINDIMLIFGIIVMKIQKNDQWKRAYYSIPDPMAKKFALEMAYKLKKRYEEGVKIINKYDGLSKEEIVEQVARRISGDS